MANKMLMNPMMEYGQLTSTITIWGSSGFRKLLDILFQIESVEDELTQN